MAQPEIITISLEGGIINDVRIPQSLKHVEVIVYDYDTEEAIDQPQEDPQGEPCFITTWGFHPDFTPDG